MLSMFVFLVLRSYFGYRISNFGSWLTRTIKIMATVWIPALLRNLTQSQETVPVAGGSVGQIIDNLDALYPGIKDRLCEGGELRRGIAVAVDAQLGQASLAQPVSENSEVHFVPAISGG
jgi:molybdopterin synthase sulfur carrier subunit